MARSTRKPRAASDRVGDFIAQAQLDKAQSELERVERGLREQLRQTKAMLEIERDERELSERRLDLALSIQEKPKASRLVAPTRKANEATAVLVASDWHVEEVVDPKTVNGKNRYDPSVAKDRAQRFFVNGARLVELSRSGAQIDTVVLALLGDLITGYIHEELEESNAMSPTEAILFVQELVTSGIDYLLRVGKVKRLIVPCIYGNHGRTTKRRRVSTGAKNSFEWLMYRTLASHFASDDRVEFLVADGAHLTLEVYGQTVRFMHGDDVRYQGGVGGLHIPLRKALDSWDHFQSADITVLGHWHQLLFGDDYVVNGSLIGYGPYALSVKARYEPPRQAFFLLDRDHGMTLRAPIRVE